MVGDSAALTLWVALGAPIVIGLLVGGLNLWANSRVSAQRDRGHEQALKSLTHVMENNHRDQKLTLSNFGERLGELQADMIRVQTGLGMGGEHGLFAEMRDTRHAVEELRRIAEAREAAISTRVALLERMVPNEASRA